MSQSLLCRLGYHKFGPWQDTPVANERARSGFSPRNCTRRKRQCARCGLEHLDYSPQVGMMVNPPLPR